MAETRIARGKIIRILNPETVIVNLGERDGVQTESVFRVVAEPESIIDPETEKALGTLALVKARVKATQVYERFTIAKSRWTTIETKMVSILDSIVSSATAVERTEHGEELRVLSDEVRPWRAESEEPVRVGDVVEVRVPVDAKIAPENPPVPNSTKEGK